MRAKRRVANSYSDSLSYSDFHPDSDTMHGEMCTDAPAASDAGAASVGVIAGVRLDSNCRCVCRSSL